MIMFLSDAEKNVPLGFILVQISDKMFDDHIVVESPGKLQEKVEIPMILLACLNL